MPRENFDESQLIQSAREGNTQALAQLFETYRPQLERMIHARIDPKLKRRIDPADVLQEAFLTIQQKLPEYARRADLPFFLWIRLETGQQLMKLHRFHLQTKARDAKQEVFLHHGWIPSVSSISLADRLIGQLTTASAVVSRSELKLRLQAALDQMSEMDREILVMRHFEELSNAETAAILEISPTAASNRHIRALERIREVLEEMPDGTKGLL